MIELTGEDLSIHQLIDISRNHKQVSIAHAARIRVDNARQSVIEILKARNVVYGINTGFGSLSDVRVADEDLSHMQKNLLLSHACGSGERLSKDVVRGMIALRINALIKGYSGVRMRLIEQMVIFLNEDIVPVVYAQGSLGASGDLVPLAHMALPLIGEGEVLLDDQVVFASHALKQKGIKPIETLAAKEGLALINGTQAMTSIGAHTLYDGYKTFLYATMGASLTFEALGGIVDVFNDNIHAVRPHPGQRTMAAMMRKTLGGSHNVSHQGDDHVQDAYSLRCVPQVHGATLDALDYVHDVVVREMNSVTDNPLIFPGENKALSAGNFHGQPLALAFDYLAIALSELANISERRLERLVNSQLNQRLPPFLTKEKGRNSGFMIIQYVAASLVSENKTLSHPASVDSIPSSANKEDHVSMGTIAARKAAQILKHTRKVAALELFTAAQAVDFKGLSHMSGFNKQTYSLIRNKVPFIEEDTYMKPHMDAVEKLLLDDAFNLETLEAMLWRKA